MDIIPNHRIVFEIDGVELPDVPNPIYIPKKGDIIKAIGAINEKNEREDLGEYKVVNVEHELFDVFVGEQHVIVYLEKVK